MDGSTHNAVVVVGLGYVGLPLAVAFGSIRPTIGFDVDGERVAELMSQHDRTHETDADELAGSTHLAFTSDAESIAGASIYIITVPTPIDSAKRPDLTPLVLASETVGRAIRRGALVVYESTVYPGATEEVCVPVLEKQSGLRLNVDFFVGYSPERINPGDREHRLANIVKVTSGSSPEAAEAVDVLYRQVIDAGTYRAPSIRVAEAAKVIENTQRDVNIALVNELAVLFRKLELDTNDILAAAETKWNFLPFRPGLVGGHCIGVDPYYLTHKAQQVGHHSDMILAGRRTNDSMAGVVADEVVRLMALRKVSLLSSRVLILGLAFKEDCPDIRNTKVVDVISRLGEYGIEVDVCDPCVDPLAAKSQYNIDLLPLHQIRMQFDRADEADSGADGNAGGSPYGAVILAVSHKEFRDLGPQLRAFVGPRSVMFDVKAAWPREIVDGRL